MDETDCVTFSRGTNCQGSMKEGKVSIWKASMTCKTSRIWLWNLIIPNGEEVNGDKRFLVSTEHLSMLTTTRMSKYVIIIQAVQYDDKMEWKWISKLLRLTALDKGRVTQDWNKHLFCHGDRRKGMAEWQRTRTCDRERQPHHSDVAKREHLEMKRKLDIQCKPERALER